MISVPVKADVDSEVSMVVVDSSEVLSVVVSVPFVSLAVLFVSAGSVVPVDSLEGGQDFCEIHVFHLQHVRGEVNV